MIDVHIRDLGEEIQQEWEQTVGKLPHGLGRRTAQKITDKILRIVRHKKGRISLRESDILHIYQKTDIHKICQDLAEGKDVPVYISFVRTKRLRPSHVRHIQLRQHDDMSLYGSS